MKTATRLLSLLALLAFSATASAQEQLTVREIISVPQENLDQLMALGADADETAIDTLIDFVYDGEEVQFTAVVLSDPYTSGLASWVDEINAPGRVHVFVRDTTANSQGYGGMTVQLVDGGGERVLDMQPGFVYDIIGTVSEFGNVIQVAPTAVNSAGLYSSLGLPDEILEPIEVSTDDLNRVVGEDEEGNDVYQANWANFNDLNNQYVRFDRALVLASVAANTGRPNYQWVSDGATAVVNADDISLRYRNDRSGADGYPNPPYAKRPTNDPFVPPPTGAVVEVQGFAALRAFDFDNDILEAAMSVAPWEDSDLNVLESPPIFGATEGPEDVPGDEAVSVSVSVSPGANRTVDSVVLSYEASTGESGDVTLTDDGSGVYSGDIPAVADGAFVTYSVTATDNTGATSTSASGSYRVLYDGITSVEDIQRTTTAGPGASPFAGITTERINLDVTVQTAPIEVTEASSTFTMLVVQDGTGPWSGVIVLADETSVGLEAGDEITITKATIRENFGVTRLSDITYEETGSGTPYGYITNVTTGLLAQDDATAEAYEGMMIRFDDVVITDAAADNFGGFAFADDGNPDNAVLGEDDATTIPADFTETTFSDEAAVEFIQGVWYYSFSNYKVLLTSTDDVGMVTVDAEGGAQPSALALGQAYPNPFVGRTTIAYELREAGPVSLKVYDTLGREVATLVNAELAPSRYEVAFDASDLAAGVYVYRLTAGGEVRTGRMTLVK